VVKCCTKEVVCSHRLFKGRGNIGNKDYNKNNCNNNSNNYNNNFTNDNNTDGNC